MTATDPLEHETGFDQISASGIRRLIGLGEYLKAFDLGERYLNSTDSPDTSILKLHAQCMSKLGLN